MSLTDQEKKKAQRDRYKRSGLVERTYAIPNVPKALEMMKKLAKDLCGAYKSDQI